MLSAKFDIRVVANAEELSKAAAEEFVHRADEAVQARGIFTIALSGGSTPKSLYTLLASEPWRGQVPWNKVHFFWGDERHVPPDHPDNKYRMVQERLLSQVPVPPENVHRIKTENPDAGKAADEYEQVLRDFFELRSQKLPRFDLVLLGMGPDGHTDITNHYNEPVELQLMLAVRSDFADIFQVKSQKLLARGKISSTWKDGALTTEYRNGEFYRGIQIAPDSTTSPARYANGRIFLDVALDPGETWHTCVNFTALADEDVLQPKHTCVVTHVTAATKVLDDFVNGATQLQSSNVQIATYYRQALVNMGSLRIEVEKNGRHFWMAAAGIPWFVAVFGRDSLIASLQTMAVGHEFGRSTLVELGSLQATEVDDWRDAQPSKILHEMRRGELAQLHEIPHTPYYGTVDATILWIIPLAEAYCWNADRNMLAASYFEAGRMPELFAGIERRPDGFPVPYPDANIPQAWAAGAIFLLLRTIPFGAMESFRDGKSLRWMANYSYTPTIALAMHMAALRTDEL